MVLSREMVVIEKVEFEGVLKRLEQLEEIILNKREETYFRERVNSLATGSFLETPAICQLMNWSRKTFSRRRDSGHIPVVQDGRKYKITVEDFITWHKENYQS